jgi:lipoyl-dependent peroxiredoxin subunit D
MSGSRIDMSIEALADAIPDFAKDVRLNLSSLARDESLSEQQRYGLLLACAIATRNPRVRAAMEAEARGKLVPAALDAARAAASIMAMNNVYYRFKHLVAAPDYASLPARLRMNVIANPGVPSIDFELWSLAVSAINGCGLCIDSHEQALRKAGVSTDVIHTAIRMASVVQSVAVALEAGEAAAA